MEFDGEDRNRWGYFITAGEVKDVEYNPVVEGKLLRDVIKEFEKSGKGET